MIKRDRWTDSSYIVTQRTGLPAAVGEVMLGNSFNTHTGVLPDAGATMSKEIAKCILEHFRNGGTLDDGKIAALYRLANGLAPDTKTDAAVVGRWAFDAATHLDLDSAGWNKMALSAIPRGNPRIEVDDPVSRDTWLRQSRTKIRDRCASCLAVHGSG